MRHQHHRTKRLAVCAAALGAFALVGAPAIAGASPGTTSPVVGYVYVNDNTTGVNTIAGFARHADASLTPLTGSPFVAGGTGSGRSLASQGALQITPDDKFIVAVDAGSNQLSVLKVENDGSLKLLPGGLVSSGGTLPVSVAIHNNLVYVATPGRPTRTTPASPSARAGAWPPCRARPSPCPTALSPGT